jgi:ribosomal protein S18 acetylase RimI-like enzyme
MVVFRAMEENLRATLANFSRANSGETREFPGVAVTSSGVQFSMFNSALLTSPVSTPREIEQRIQTAGQFFAARNLPWSFWVCQGWIEQDLRSKVGIVFDRNRMHLVVELPGMAAERIEPPERPLPRLTIRRVSQFDTRADFNHIMSIAFGIPMPISRAVYEAERTWTGDFTGYVAYSEDLPASSAAIVVTGSVAGVYAVGTLPYCQHRGYGEAVMRHALEQVGVANAIECTVLQSSEAGFSLYRKMGFRTVTRYAVFAT